MIISCLWAFGEAQHPVLSDGHTEYRWIDVRDLAQNEMAEGYRRAILAAVAVAGHSA